MRIAVEMVVLVSGLLGIFNFAIQRLYFRPKRNQLSHNEYVREMERQNRELDELKEKISNH